MDRWMFPIELKVTVDADIDGAVESLNMKDGKSRKVWFLDDSTPGLGAEIPVLSAGVILGLRSDSKRDQPTVRLRPSGRSQPLGRWRTAFENGNQEDRIENDWARSRRVLAASCVAEFAPGTFGST